MEELLLVELRKEAAMTANKLHNWLLEYIRLHPDFAKDLLKELDKEK
jgi:uncharacterized membrane protein YvbJ